MKVHFLFVLCYVTLLSCCDGEDGEFLSSIRTCGVVSKSCYCYIVIAIGEKRYGHLKSTSRRFKKKSHTERR